MPQVRPVTGLFECLHANGNTTAMLYDWEELRDLARPGAMTKKPVPVGRRIRLEQTGAQLCESAKAYLSGGGIDFAFLYLGWPDAAGHTYGWLSDEYFRAVNATCDRVGEVVDCLGDEYTIILTADHGGHDRCHGFDCPEDMTIPVFFPREAVQGRLRAARGVHQGHRAYRRRAAGRGCAGGMGGYGRPMERIEDKQRVTRLMLLFMATYLVSYLTRVNYAAVVTEIADAEGCFARSLRWR